MKNRYGFKHLLLALAGVSLVGAASARNTAPIHSAAKIKAEGTVSKHRPSEIIDERVKVRAKQGQKKSALQSRVPLSERLRNQLRGSGTEPIVRADYTFIFGVTAGDFGMANDHSFRQVISKDGAFVVFGSLAQNLNDDDARGVAQVYRIPATGGTPLTVSKSSVVTNAGGNGGSGASTFSGGNSRTHELWYNGISNDGNLISFTSEADDLVAGDTNGVSDVFVWNFNAGSPTITRVSVGPGPGFAELPLESQDGVISGNGNAIVFLSSDPTVTGSTTRAQDFTNLPDWTGATFLTGMTLSQDVFWRSFPLNASPTDLKLVTHANGAPNTEANSDSYQPSISDDGSTVAYASRATNLTADVLATNLGSDPAYLQQFYPRTHVYWWDSVSNVSTMVSKTAAGAILAPTASGAAPFNALEDCHSPFVSGSGNYVVWQSRKALAATLGTGANRTYATKIKGAGSGNASNRRINLEGSSGGITVGSPWISDDGLVASMINFLGDGTFNGSFNVTVHNRATDADQFALVADLTINVPFVDDVAYTPNYPQMMDDTFNDAQATRPAMALVGGTTWRSAIMHNDPILLTGDPADDTTGGFNNIYTVEIDSAFSALGTITKLTNPGSTDDAAFGFGDHMVAKKSNNERAAISPSGRYMAAVVNNFVSSTLYQFPQAGASVVLFDLQTGNMDVASLDTTDNLIDGGSFIAAESGYGFEGQVGAFGLGATRTAFLYQGIFLQDFIGLGFWAPAVSDNGVVVYSCLGASTFSGATDDPIQSDPTWGGGYDAETQIVYTNPGATEAFVLRGTDVTGDSQPDPLVATGGIFFNDANQITPNGQYIAFHSDARNVTADSPLDGTNMVYVHDTVSKANRMMSRTRDTGTGNSSGVPISDCLNVAISANGQKVLFVATGADDILVPGGAAADLGHMFIMDDLSDGVADNGFGQVYLVTANNARTKFADTTQGGSTADDAFTFGFMNFADMSADGSKVIFEATWDTALAADAGFVGTTTGNQVWLKTVGATLNGVAAGTLELLSTGTDNQPLTFDDIDPLVNEATSGSSLSFFGEAYSYATNADDIVATDANGRQTDVFHFRPSSTDPVIASSTDSGAQTDLGTSRAPETASNLITGETFVAFISDADATFWAGDTAQTVDLFVKFYNNAVVASNNSWHNYE